MKRLWCWLRWLRNGRSSLEIAWIRIEALEKTNSALAAELLFLQGQVAALQRTVNPAESAKAPKHARNWREVQNFVGESNA